MFESSEYDGFINSFCAPLFKFKTSVVWYETDVLEGCSNVIERSSPCDKIVPLEQAKKEKENFDDVLTFDGIEISVLFKYTTGRGSPVFKACVISVNKVIK